MQFKVKFMIFTISQIKTHAKTIYEINKPEMFSQIY